MAKHFADFHTHTILSDGALLPEELLRRMIVLGYTTVAITDHVGWSNCAAVVDQVARACEQFRHHSPIAAIPGVEITHVPASGIAEVAALAKRSGARLVVVHGETAVEPVEPGTNHAAACCPDVDILAHPGFLTDEDAALAAQNGVYVEISGRKGHSLTNGHVVKTGRRAGVRFLVNSDGHDPSDLMSRDFATKVARGAGLEEAESIVAAEVNPGLLLRQLGLVQDA